MFESGLRLKSPHITRAPFWWAQIFRKVLLIKRIWLEFGAYRLTIVYVEELISQINILYRPLGSAIT